MPAQHTEIVVLRTPGHPMRVIRVYDSEDFELLADYVRSANNRRIDEITMEAALTMPFNVHAMVHFHEPYTLIEWLSSRYGLNSPEFDD